MVLRGIFTLRRSELLFFYQDGSSHLFPEQFEPYREYIPKEERKDMMSAYYKRLTGVDEGTRLEAAKHWSTWENATSKLFIDHEHVRKAQEDDKVCSRRMSNSKTHRSSILSGHLLLHGLRRTTLFMEVGLRMVSCFKQPISTKYGTYLQKLFKDVMTSSVQQRLHMSFIENGLRLISISCPITATALGK